MRDSEILLSMNLICLNEKVCLNENVESKYSIINANIPIAIINGMSQASWKKITNTIGAIK